MYSFYDSKEVVGVKQVLTSAGFVALAIEECYCQTRNVFITNGKFGMLRQMNFVGACDVLHGTCLVNNGETLRQYCLVAGTGVMVICTPELIQREDIVIAGSGIAHTTADRLYQLLSAEEVPGLKKPEDNLHAVLFYTKEAKEQRFKKAQADERRWEAFTLRFICRVPPSHKEEAKVFLQKLKNFDWYYGYSDDIDVWRSGHELQKEYKNQAEALGIPDAPYLVQKYMTDPGANKF